MSTWACSARGFCLMLSPARRASSSARCNCVVLPRKLLQAENWVMSRR